jgi:mannitol/fructose-specific phosphotransferase system IIA component (Ntr-type)
MDGIALKDSLSMVITKFVSKSCILPQMSATNKADALKELTHLLFDKKKMKNMNLALDQIVAREATESTGIGRGIAVPHARVAGMKGLICAVGRVPQGLDFMAVDRKPVQLVFLICYPPTEQTTYLNFVASVAKLLGDKAHLNAILGADSADGIYDILEDISTTYAECHPKQTSSVELDPEIEKMPDAHADLILLARMQLLQEMLSANKKGKGEIIHRIDNIRTMVDPRILKHYDRLMKSRAPALVPVEGDTCQGCFMKLASKLVQQVRQDSVHIHTCPNCSRYIYVV